jgi:hypothetical protein
MKSTKTILPRFARGASSCGAALLLALAAPSVLHADVLSDFEVDAEGWIIVDLPNALGDPPPIMNSYAVDYSATDGNPGGHISEFDPSSIWFHFAAPAKFLGDKSTYYGGRITYDMSTTLNSGDASFPAVILIGANKSLFYPSQWPQTTFTPFNIRLLPAGWKIGDYETGAEPTAEEMQEVLADLDALYIDGDWSTADELSRLDNVRLLLPSAIVSLNVKKKVAVGPNSKTVLLKGTSSANTVRVTVNGKPAIGIAKWKSRVKFPAKKKTLKVRVVATSDTGATTTKTVTLVRRR